MAEVCKAYGWTYDQYLDQPWGFIKTIMQMMDIDNRKAAAPKAKR